MSCPIEPDSKASDDQHLVRAVALVIALSNGRESASRSDYAHPNFTAIKQILIELLRGKPQ